MKKIKILTVAVLSMLLSACGDYGEKRIVKLVTINDENISFYYYDFTEEKPTIIVEQKENTGIEDTMTQMLSEHEYDLKLCRFVVCDKPVIENNMNNLTASLLNSRFSPDISIIEGDTKEKSEKYIDGIKMEYPLYSFDVTSDGVSGIVENRDTGEKHVIQNGNIYVTLNRSQSFAVDIAGNVSDKGVYVFEHNGKIFTANLEKINTYYSADKNVNCITVSAVLKSYKGMPAGKEDKEQFVKLLEKNLNDDIAGIYDDSVMVKTLKLDWFRQINDTNKIKINITIK